MTVTVDRRRPRLRTENCAPAISAHCAPSLKNPALKEISSPSTCHPEPQRTWKTDAVSASWVRGEGTAPLL